MNEPRYRAMSILQPVVSIFCINQQSVVNLLPHVGDSRTAAFATEDGKLRAILSTSPLVLAGITTRRRSSRRVSQLRWDQLRNCSAAAPINETALHAAADRAEVRRTDQF